MTSYTATFSRGETKTLLNSKREYRAAWLVEATSRESEKATHWMGFAATREMAEKAAQREFASVNSTPRHLRHLPKRAPFWTLNRIEVIDL